MTTDELRPTTLDGYHGQDNLKARLTIKVEAAIKRDMPLEHILLAGSPGSGKTTLGAIVADMMGLDFMSVGMPINDRALVRIVSNFNGILLLDECHRATPKQQEQLLPLLEFGYLVTPTGRRIENGWLTVLGATTEPQKVIKPLSQRMWVPLIEDYTIEQMHAIVLGMVRMAGMELSADITLALATAAGGIPRQAKRLVTDARDLIATGNDEPSIEDILALSGMSTDGMSEAHLAYLHALDKLGGTGGITMIATMLRLHESVCKDLERLLIDRDFVTYASGVGRELTGAGHRRIHAQRKVR